MVRMYIRMYYSYAIYLKTYCIAQKFIVKNFDKFNGWLVICQRVFMVTILERSNVGEWVNLNQLIGKILANELGWPIE